MEYLIKTLITNLKKYSNIIYINSSSLIIKYIDKTEIKLNFIIITLKEFKDKLNNIDNINIKRYLEKEIEKIFYEKYKSEVNISLNLSFNNNLENLKYDKVNDLEDLECNKVNEMIKTNVSIIIKFYKKENYKLFIKDLIEQFFINYLMDYYDNKTFTKIKIYYKDLHINISTDKEFYHLLITKENIEKILEIILPMTDEIYLTIYKNNKKDFEISIDYDNHNIFYLMIINTCKILSNIFNEKYKNIKQLLNDIDKEFSKLKLFTILV